ncbi:MAG: hypothetical protein HYY18_21295 [Planctomycetes bacterium]|nr:hypothetical protein [Planctomycetota bacterium]
MTIYDKSQSQKNAFERLLAKIPGFRGYLAKENRRESDKLEREFIAKAFDAAREPLRRTVRAVADSGNFDALRAVAGIDPLEKLVEKVANRVRFADYGYSGFFDAVKIGEPELERLYAFDLALYERAEQLEKRTRELPSLANDGDALKAEVSLLEQLVREIDRDFDQRERIVTG